MACCMVPVERSCRSPGRSTSHPWLSPSFPKVNASFGQLVHIATQMLKTSCSRTRTAGLEGSLASLSTPFHSKEKDRTKHGFGWLDRFPAGEASAALPFLDFNPSYECLFHCPARMHPSSLVQHGGDGCTFTPTSSLRSSLLHPMEDDPFSRSRLSL